MILWETFGWWHLHFDALRTVSYGHTLQVLRMLPYLVQLYAKLVDAHAYNDGTCDALKSLML